MTADQLAPDINEFQMNLLRWAGGQENFRTGRMVLADSALMPSFTRMQRAGLVRVEPRTADSALVTLTDAGWTFLEEPHHADR